MSPALPGGFFTASATWEAPHNGEGQSFQRIVLGKLDSHMQKNETEPLSYTTHKNHLKTLKIRMYDLTRKLLEENTGSKLLDISLEDDCLNLTKK